METEKGKGGESPDPKSISLSQSTDDASDVYRNTVYKYCSASSKSVEPGQLINILKNSIGGSLDNFNNRMSNIEVIMAQILTAVNENKAEKGDLFMMDIGMEYILYICSRRVNICRK